MISINEDRFSLHQVVHVGPRVIGPQWLVERFRLPDATNMKTSS